MERKRIQSVDAIALIAGAGPSSIGSELRASAIARMSNLQEQIRITTHDAEESFRAKEAEYLEAVATWKMAASASERAEAALIVGRLQKSLAALDTLRQSSRYPHRYVQEKKLYRSVLDADTKDMRFIPFPVFTGSSMTTVAAERGITVEDRV